MFDFDVTKIILFCIVALIVVGPKDLPQVLRTAGQITGRLRRMVAKLQADVMKAADEAELKDIQAEIAATTGLAGLDISYDPATAMRGRSAARTGAPSAQPTSAKEPVYASPEMQAYLDESSAAEPAPVEALEPADPPPSLDAASTAAENTRDKARVEA